MIKGCPVAREHVDANTLAMLDHAGPPGPGGMAVGLLGAEDP